MSSLIACPSDSVVPASPVPASTTVNPFTRARETKLPTIVSNAPYLPTSYIHTKLDNKVLTNEVIKEEIVQLVNAINSSLPSPGVTNNFNVVMDRCSGWLLSTSNTGDNRNSSNYKLTKLTGGITNVLYYLQYENLLNPNSPSTVTLGGSNNPGLLIRLFGGSEALINRDNETLLFSELCFADIGYQYFARFGGPAPYDGSGGIPGRIEGFLVGMKPLCTEELALEEVSMLIGSSLGVMHNFGGEREQVSSLWTQIREWMDVAITNTENAGGLIPFQKGSEAFRTAPDLQWLNSKFLEWEDICRSKGYSISFCHNDLLSGNIMSDCCCDKNGKRKLKLIDFEYGGMNYSAFDIANHFNEWSGGTDDARPDYSKKPTKAQQLTFIKSYLLSKNGGPVSDEVLLPLLEEVDFFRTVNHFYWGLWAYNQACEEGCEEFDYRYYCGERMGEGLNNLGLGDKM